MAYDPLKNHAVHGALKRLNELSKSSQLTDLNEEIDDQRRWYLDRIFFLAAKAQERIDAAVGPDVSINAANNLANSAESIRQELENYVANKNVGHIDNAFNQSEQGFAIYLAQITDLDHAPPDNLQSSLNSFREASRSAISELRANVRHANNGLGEIEQQVEQDKSELASIREGIESFRTKASEITDAMEQSLEEKLAGFDGTFENRVNGWETIQAMKLKSIEDKGEYYLKQLDDKRKEASQIVQSVGDILTTGTYRDTAEKEATLANRFRLVTIGLFSVGILIVVSNFIMHVIANLRGVPYEENVWIIASRFATAVAVALPALYTARESARHRTNADRARQRELELTTLGPFIELLPNEKKQEIRDRLTDRYFGAAVEKHEVNGPIDAETVAKLAEAIAKLRG